METRSTFRSRISSTNELLSLTRSSSYEPNNYLRGRCRFDNPVESCANKAFPPAECERDAVSKASLIFVSSFFATISAALPLGERMYGTWPDSTSDRAEAGAANHKPIVATALNKPFAMRSISSSICCSVDAGELRMAYVDGGAARVDGAGCC